MVYFEAKNTGDAKASARLFNTEIGLFGPTRSGNALKIYPFQRPIYPDYR